jgi:hypothetical protein
MILDMRKHPPFSKNRIVVGVRGYDGARGAVYLFGDPNDSESGRSYSQLAMLFIGR